MSEKDMDKIKEDLESNADREAAHYQSESETNEHTLSKASNESKSSRETEILMKMPPEARKTVEVGMSMMRQVGPVSHPLVEKINEKHIDRILQLSDQSDARAFEETTQSRWFTLAYVVIAACVFIFLTAFLVGMNADLYMEIIKLLVVFLGGLGGGFGIKTISNRNKGG